MKAKNSSEPVFRRASGSRSRLRRSFCASLEGLLCSYRYRGLRLLRRDNPNLFARSSARTVFGSLFQRRSSACRSRLTLFYPLQRNRPRSDRFDIDAGLIHDLLVVIDDRSSYVKSDPVIFTVFAVNIETRLDKLGTFRIDNIVQFYELNVAFQKVVEKLMLISEMSGAPTPDCKAIAIWYAFRRSGKCRSLARSVVRDDLHSNVLLFFCR